VASALTRGAICALLLFLLGSASAQADLLPARLAPAAPFPQILEQAPTVESVAPGIDYGEYALLTAAGPLSVHVIAVDPRRGDVRLANVLANNALESRGETVASMAQRTAAVAGINGDYFDIGNTNRPQNIVVRDGTLLQLPKKRYALAISRDGSARIAEFTFAGQLVIADRTMPLDAIDQLPPPNGNLSLITPEYGKLRPQDNVTLVQLQPIGGTPPLARYRVTGIADNSSVAPPGYYVAIGLNDYGAIGVPDAGAIVTAGGTLDPIDAPSLATAIGGGPLILHGGAWYDDPDGPAGGEYARRIPCSGAAVAPDGRIFLVEVDGRQPEVSVGLKRPEFAALMRALGATEGMAFDGGGSSTMAVRRLGDGAPGMVTSPSDGKERPVGDGLFVYSTAPVGPAVRLVARPGVVRAVAGAAVPLRVAAVDAANHVAVSGTAVSASVVPASLGTFDDGRFVARRAGTGRLALRADRLTGSVPVEVVSAPARVKIVPARPNVAVGGAIVLAARAYDARGYPLALPATLRWTAAGASIAGNGALRAGSRNADVTVRVGTVITAARVTVGSHDVALPFAQNARFVTAPHGGKGSVTAGEACATCVRLTFALGRGERAAYAMAAVALPPDTIGIAFDLEDDGSGGRVRVSVRNEINEDTLLDAARLGVAGWRGVVVRFPVDTQAARLTAIYVLPPRGVQTSAGSIVVRNVRAIVAGR
jgi:hypothetical protein